MNISRYLQIFRDISSHHLRLSIPTSSFPMRSYTASSKAPLEMEEDNPICLQRRSFCGQNRSVSPVSSSMLLRLIRTLSISHVVLRKHIFSSWICLLALLQLLVCLLNLLLSSCLRSWSCLAPSLYLSSSAADTLHPKAPLHLLNCLLFSYRRLDTFRNGCINL